MSRVKDVCDRARSLWLRVVRSTRPVDDVENDELYRLIDGKNKVISGPNFEASRFDIETDLSRWESYKPPNRN
ncbi:hypothetical protein [Mesorhizobium neociceri]|uniref:Uncharacterized protein n=1 Tax=Mesorhizobium neociceri TaxID=1307853 RepID=A0A838B454_9HYPH|nr:hypothetical protein [Mesorhizobium neociceri]MBA1140250.1 hypothetical protein [Mesorhizobium neociceri]